LLEELRPLMRESDHGRFETLKRELNEYWTSYDPLFSTTSLRDPFDFLRREVVPRRDDR
jgi:hypothetical protein